MESVSSLLVKLWRGGQVCSTATRRWPSTNHSFGRAKRRRKRLPIDNRPPLPHLLHMAKTGLGRGLGSLLGRARRLPQANPPRHHPNPPPRRILPPGQARFPWAKSSPARCNRAPVLMMSRSTSWRSPSGKTASCNRSSSGLAREATNSSPASAVGVPHKWPAWQGTGHRPRCGRPDSPRTGAHRKPAARRPRPDRGIQGLRAINGSI